MTLVKSIATGVESIISLVTNF